MLSTGPLTAFIDGDECFDLRRLGGFLLSTLCRYVCMKKAVIDTPELKSMEAHRAH